MIKTLLDGCMAVNAGTAVNVVMCINGILFLTIIGTLFMKKKPNLPEGMSPVVLIGMCLGIMFVCTYFGLVMPDYIPPGSPMPTDCSYIITF